MVNVFTDRLISHAELFFDQAEVDASLHNVAIYRPMPDFPEGYPGGPRDDLPPVPDTVQILIDDNQDVWKPFISHKFPKNLANGTGSLDGFRYYMIQDKAYIETYLRVRMMSVATSTSFTDVANFAAKAPSTIKYVETWNEICANQLGVSQSEIDDTPLSEQMTATQQFYTSVARDGDWFMMHVALLPCIIGYYDITAKLLTSPSTTRNTVYHPFFTVINADDSYVNAYRRFLNDNFAKYYTPENEKRWNEIFRRSCELEKGFFDIGAGSPSPFHIVEDGVCEIQHFGNGRLLDVRSFGSVLYPLSSSDIGTLDSTTRVTDVAGHRLTLSEYTLVTSGPLEAKNTKWELKATADGYTIRNVNTQLYVKFDGDGKRAILTKYPAYWWINPVSTMPPDKKTYQCLAAGNLQYALQVDESARSFKWLRWLTHKHENQDGVQKHLQQDERWFWPLTIDNLVVSKNNYQGSSQMWKFQYASD